MTAETKQTGTELVPIYKIPDDLAELEQRILDSLNEDTGEYEVDPADLAKQVQLAERADVGINWYSKKNQVLKAHAEGVKSDLDEIRESMNEEIKRVTRPHRVLIESLEARQRSIENDQAFIYSLIHEIMQVTKRDEFITATGKKVYYQPFESLEVDADAPLETWDPEYVKVTRTVKKKEVKEAIKSGKWGPPQGARLVTKQTLRLPK